MWHSGFHPIPQVNKLPIKYSAIEYFQGHFLIFLRFETKIFLRTNNVGIATQRAWESVRIEVAAKARETPQVILLLEEAKR
ncbi:hypothetical protein ET524_10840 [Senegalimassilia faecalis]|uniref:Uncharacterized protein n=1 Tax=Senegalimassilia faecalis TaxID=2509433 RepID=A0A4Q2K4Z6_9ACTN|nr:hypothetical protein [Senegalimassilia faecalis]RXZ54923.1 hypothetical protein ET524_10840 [Senegalimassilia faecalis]